MTNGFRLKAPRYHYSHTDGWGFLGSAYLGEITFSWGTTGLLDLELGLLLCIFPPIDSAFVYFPQVYLTHD